MLSTFRAKLSSRFSTSNPLSSIPSPLPCKGNLPSNLSKPIKRSASSSVTPIASSAAPTTNTTQNKARARPFIYVLGLMPLVTFGLGTWQVMRLNWKLDMIDQLEKKLNQNMVRLPARIDPAAIPEFAYRKVFVTGTFDYDHEILLGPRTREGELGFHIITPLIRGDGLDTILVNRGFVKRIKKNQSERPESLTQGKVELVAMLRDQDQANSFTPPNNVEKGEWVFANIEEMAKYAGTEPVLVDEIFSGHAGQISMRVASGIPVGRSATIEMRNQHMTYAVTWYALSLATAVMFLKLVKKPRRGLTAAEYRNIN